MSKLAAFSHLLTWRATAIIVALLIGLLAIVITVNSPKPAIDEQFGDTSLHFAADRAWSLFPGDCVKISWRTEGIESLYIEGRGEIGWGEEVFCPQIKHTAARFAVRSPDGLQREFQLRVHFLPDLLLYLTGFVGIFASVGAACFFLLSKDMERMLPWRVILLGLCALAVMGTWLRLRPHQPAQYIYANDGVVVQMWTQSKSSLLFPGECVAVYWSQTGARSARFGGMPIDVSENPGRAKFCSDAAGGPILEVASHAGELTTHTLPLSIHPFAAAGHTAFIALQVAGMLIAACVFLLQIVAAVRRTSLRRQKADFVALAAVFIVTLLLYLPFGFDIAPHREIWMRGPSLQGLGSFLLRGEMVSRYFGLMPHTLATLLDSESFIGFNTVHFFLHFGKVSLLYIILRQLGWRRLVAFLAAALFLAYPVNDGLMSLRSLPLNHSMFWLLVGTSMMLVWLKAPRRRNALAVLLALLLNVATSETGYMLIVSLPLLWWLDGRHTINKRLHATVLWLAAPVFKAAFLALLIATGRPYYGGGGGGAVLAVDSLEAVTSILTSVYHQTFIQGWFDAIDSLAHSPPTLLALCCIGTAALVLARMDRSLPESPRKISAGLLVGLLYVIPAVGILMWLTNYALCEIDLPKTG